MAVRVTDLVFRTGDHEVGILMSDCTADGLATVARRVIEAMGEVTCADGRQAVLTSAFALYPDHVADPLHLPRAARARQQLFAITG
jgi:hypothetical protein